MESTNFDNFDFDPKRVNQNDLIQIINDLLSADNVDQCEAGANIYAAGATDEGVGLKRSDIIIGSRSAIYIPPTDIRSTKIHTHPCMYDGRRFSPPSAGDYRNCRLSRYDYVIDMTNRKKYKLWIYMALNNDGSFAERGVWDMDNLTIGEHIHHIVADCMRLRYFVMLRCFRLKTVKGRVVKIQKEIPFIMPNFRLMLDSDDDNGDDDDDDDDDNGDDNDDDDDNDNDNSDDESD